METHVDRKPTTGDGCMCHAPSRVIYYCSFHIYLSSLYNLYSFAYAYNINARVTASDSPVNPIPPPVY